MSNDNNDINNIIDQLKNDSITPQPKIENNFHQTPTTIDDKNVDEYVYKKSSELVESTLSAISSFRDNILAGSDPKEISALSQLINSASKALDQLNKINLQNKQAKTNIEIKKMEIESNSKISKLLPHTNNIVIATRDEIMKKMFDKTSIKKEKFELVDSELIE